MTLEIRVINLKKAMREDRQKNIVRYKFRMYKHEYEEKDKDVFDKQEYRDLSLDYHKYMMRKDLK